MPLAVFLALVLALAPRQDPDVPILDAHNHVMPGLDPDEMVRELDRHGICRIVLMATGTPFDKRAGLTLAAFDKHPDRVILFVGLNGIRRFTPEILKSIDGLLASGKFRGMGELTLRHYPFEREALDGSTVRAGDYTLAADSPEVLEVFALAEKHGVVLTVHMETTAETIPAFRRALAKHPKAKVIWAHQTPIKTLDGAKEEHARKADPKQIAELLDRTPSLYADLSVGYETLFLKSDDRKLPEAWRTLYESRADRFVVGLDMPFLQGWKTDGYRLRLEVLREWLKQIEPGARKKIAHENAEKLFGG